jgi:hypothetical protein
MGGFDGLSSVKRETGFKGLRRAAAPGCGARSYAP